MISKIMICLSVFISIECGLNSKYEQIGYYKMETNNGSYKRVFSIYAHDFVDSEKDWNEMEKFAKNAMYTQGGVTMVFFFNKKEKTPDITYIGEKFANEYEKYCVAAFWKYANGKETFSKYPFK